MYQDLHFYLDLGWDSYIDDLEGKLKGTLKVVNFIYQHKASVFYSKRQLDDFVNSCGDLDQSFITSYGNLLQLILSDAVQKNINSYAFEVCFSKENTSLNYIENKLISAIEPHNKIVVFSLSRLLPKTLLSVESGISFRKIEYEFCSEIDSVYNWIIDKVQQRNFNLSGKHGQNGEGNWDKASPLLCSKDEAQELLSKAIPDFKERPKELFYFDTKHNTFIEFYYEGENPQKQWHGFHIGIKDWDSRVPKSVRNFFGK